MNYLRGQRPSTSAETKAKREYRESHPVCEACMFEKSSQTHHIVSKKSSGPAEDWNFLALCIFCHTEIHSKGWLKFTDRYPWLAGKIVAARIRCGRKTD